MPTPSFYQAFDFSEREIQDLFAPAVFQRGRDYLASGRVQNIEVTEEGGDCWDVFASVKGGRRYPYTVEIYFFPLGPDDGMAFESHCSCPYGYQCKHGAAVLLSLAQKARRESPQIGATSLELAKWLGELGRRLGKSAREPRERLRYELEAAPDREGRASLKLTLRRQKIAVKGGWTKGRLVSPDDLNRDQYYREFTDAGDGQVSALLRACTRPYDHSRQPVLEVTALAPLLDSMAKTGRCYWGSAEEPLALGEVLPLELDWRREGGQMQLCSTLGGRELPDSGTYLIPSADPMYIDPDTGLLGQVRTSLPTEALPLLLVAPPVPESEADRLGEQLERMVPPELLPQPLELERVTLPRYRPVPLLHIFRDDVLGTLARLRMDYGGREVSLYPERDMAAWVEDGKRIQQPRDLAQEGASGERLQQVQLKRLERGGELCFAFATGHGGEVDDPRLWLQLAAGLFPQLEEDGWRISWEEGEFTLLRADDWDAEIEEGSGQDWFGFSLGIQVGEERFDLRGLLAGLIEEVPSLQALEERSEPLILPLEDGRYLHLPQELLLPLARTLFTLFDRPEDAAAGRLSRVQALAAAVSPAPLRWSGAGEMRRLARLLAKPLKPRPAAKGFQGELRPYQQQGLAWMQRLRDAGLGGVLADDMGLGKTVQVLAMLHAEKRGRRLDMPALIIAPTSLLGNWWREAERFAPTLTTLVWHGHDREMEDPFAGCDLVITTYGLLVRSAELLCAQPWHYLVLDEAQQIKNPRSKAAHCAVELDARHRLCLSGTPMENHLGELWSLFNFAIPGYLGDDKQFRNNYRAPIEQRGDGEQAQLLARRVAPFLLRRTKDQVAGDLPDKVEITRTIPLSAKQADLYENVRLAMDKRVRQALAKKGLARSHITVLDALLKLRQICCDPALLPKSHGGRGAPSAKRDYFVELMRELVDEGRRILVFSQFTSMLALLEKSLENAGIAHLKLTGQTRKRERVIDAFRAGQAPVFLISLKAGGVGLNLVEADTVIHYDPWWNPAVENQATDRAHRIGQDKTVFVYRLVAENTVEEKILALQQSKEQLADAVYREGAAGAGALSEADITELIAPAATHVPMSSSGT